MVERDPHLCSVVGVHVTLVVSDAHLLADLLVQDTSNVVDKVVRGGISSVGNAAPTLRLT